MRICSTIGSLYKSSKVERKGRKRWVGNPRRKQLANCGAENKSDRLVNFNTPIFFSLVSESAPTIQIHLLLRKLKNDNKVEFGPR